MIFRHLLLSAALLGTFTAPLFAQDQNTARFLKNADFGAGDKTPSSWKLVGASETFTFSRDTQTKVGGSASLKIEATAPASGDLQSDAFYPVPQGEFTISGVYQAIGDWKKASLALQGLDPKNGWGNTAWNVIADLKLASEWTPFRATMTLPANTGAALIHLQLEGVGTVRLDEIKIETSDGPRMVASADAKTVGAQTVSLKRANVKPFENVFVGGGGTVTYLTRNPKIPTEIWAIADVTGAMKYDVRTNTWKHMTDAFGPDNTKLQHGELIALDAGNANHILYSAGKEWQTGQDSIVLSNDGGKTWTPVPLKNRKGESVYISNGRTGERLQIDPNNGQIALYGSRKNGLFRTDDGGKSWRQIEIMPGDPMDGVSIGYVQFDPSSRGANGSQTIYLRAVAGKDVNFETGTYRSQDGGKSWQKLPETPISTSVGHVTPNGTLYQIGTGLCRWNGTGWDNITPPTRNPGKNFHAFAVSPVDPNLLAIAEDHCGGGNAIQRSFDGGKTWERFSMDDAFGKGKNLLDVTLQPWEGQNNGLHVFQCASSLEFDALNPKKLWMTFWPGFIACPDFTAPNRLKWEVSVKGHEEICLFEMACPPKSGDGTVVAPLFSGAMDVGGFPHFDISKMPDQMYRGVTLSQWNQAPEDVTDIEFCEADPRFVAIVGGWKYADYGSYPTRNGGAGFSLDGGKTWQNFGSKPYDDAKNGKIAVSAGDKNNLVWIPRDSVGRKNGGNTPAYFSKDMGKTWTPAKGAPLGMIFDDFVYTFYNPLEQDRVTTGRFYIYDSRDGRFYRSDDGGENFVQTSKIAAQPVVHFRRHVVRAAPGIAGTVWVAADEQGLFASSDAGESFTKLEGVQKAWSFGWGMPLPGSKTPVAFLLGKIAGDNTPQKVAVYRSLDMGKTWERLSGPENGWAQAIAIQGDRQTPGRVYVGTNGRGIFTADTHAPARVAGGKSKTPAWQKIAMGAVAVGLGAKVLD